MNQKAREVPPFRKSLVSSGLFLMLAKSRLYFWIGLDYYNNYLNEQTFNQEEELISESLLNKLLFVYNRATSTDITLEDIQLDGAKLLANRSVRF